MATDNRSATQTNTTPHKTMSATASTTASTVTPATAATVEPSQEAVDFVEALHGTINATHKMGVKLASVYNKHNGDPVAIGSDIWEAWSKNPLDRSPARPFVEACLEANIVRKEASLILNASGMVSKQRISQLLAVVYDGDKSKNKNNADRKAGQGGLDSGASATDKALDQSPHSTEAPKLTPFEEASKPLHEATTPATVDLVLAMIARLPANITKADADKLARAIASKIGA